LGGTYEEKMTEGLLNKFLKDTCTAEELEEVILWIRNDSLNNDSKNLGLKDWKNYLGDEEFVDADTFNLLLDKIHHKININRSKKDSITLTTGFLNVLTKIAAILLLPVLGIYIYTIFERSVELSENTNVKVDSLEIISPIGSQTRIQLSDGSEVFLNHGSKLKYPQNFTGKTREVKLSGEGYFIVAYNPEMPFIVNANGVNIKALGTSFNVFAYPNEKVLETTLLEGTVILEQLENENNSKTICIMVPGQHVNYNIETGKGTSSTGNIEKYIAWKDGKLIFNNESIITITSKLSRWYNVEFEIKDNDIRDFTYTATFVDETLFQILDLMAIATPIRYKTQPRIKLPDGTFSKQKIIIEKKH